MSELVSVEKVSVEFAVEGGLLRRRIGTVAALSDVSLSVGQGECLGLVGESGSGKTTLGRLLCGLLTPTRGRVSCGGRPLEAFAPRERAGLVQMIFQDPAASLNPKLAVDTLLGEALRVRAALDGESAPGRAELRERARGLLKDVGLPADVLFYYPHQFSGGQKQRIAVARALAVRPRLLVADEPVSALDLSIQAQILNLLMELRQRHRLAMVLISHDLAVVARLADRLAILKEGRIVESGPTDDVLAAPSHPYTRALMDAVPALLR
jgi:peptide/nickel transport system ATP-binding protein